MLQQCHRCLTARWWIFLTVDLSSTVSRTYIGTQGDHSSHHPWLCDCQMISDDTYLTNTGTVWVSTVVYACWPLRCSISVLLRCILVFAGKVPTCTVWFKSYRFIQHELSLLSVHSKPAGACSNMVAAVVHCTQFVCVTNLGIGHLSNVFSFNYFQCRLLSRFCSYSWTCSSHVLHIALYMWPSATGSRYGLWGRSLIYEDITSEYSVCSDSHQQRISQCVDVWQCYKQVKIPWSRNTFLICTLYKYNVC